MDTNLPWIEKYRPNQLEDLISQNEIVHTLQKFIAKGKLPHLLLYGPPGTGKTTTILAIAKQLYPDRAMYNSCVLELNASDDRGIGVVRLEILNFVGMSTIKQTAFKLVILDEVDSMTKDAQNALRRIIEKYTKTTRFCLICNYQNKIIPAIQSRCTRFRFSPLKMEEIKPRLDFIVKHENVNLTADGMESLKRLSNGDMRQAINVLQSTAIAFDVVNEESIYSCVGQPRPVDISKILESLLNDDLNTASAKLMAIRQEKGIALQDIITELHRMLLRVEFPDSILIDVTIKLADIEQRISLGCSEKLQSSALVAAFYGVRDRLGQQHA